MESIVKDLAKLQAKRTTLEAEIEDLKAQEKTLAQTIQAHPDFNVPGFREKYGKLVDVRESYPTSAPIMVSLLSKLPFQEKDIYDVLKKGGVTLTEENGWADVLTANRAHFSIKTEKMDVETMRRVVLANPRHFSAVLPGSMNCVLDKNLRPEITFARKRGALLD